MLATVTVKGQVTVPKAIRDYLKIESGTQLDFKLNDDGSILLRLLKRSALSIVGLLKRPGRGRDDRADESGGGGSRRRAQPTLAQAEAEATWCWSHWSG